MLNEMNSSQLSAYISSKLDFVRPIYRALFSKRRTYAAFEGDQLTHMLTELRPCSPILDPMSGYGLLSYACRRVGVSTCSIELNPPSYLWQVLMDISRVSILLEAIDCLRITCSKLRCNQTIGLEASDGWFPLEAIRILEALWSRAYNKFSMRYSKEVAEDFLAAVLLPFVGRLSSHSAGDMNIQVKQGGVVFFRTWREDFKRYLSFLEEYLLQQGGGSLSSKHEIIFGDVTKSLTLRPRQFSYMITSPPYPNMRDYYAFFFPENYALENIFNIERFKNGNIRESMIGGSIVSSFKRRENNSLNFAAVYSNSAKRFLSDLNAWKGPKKSMRDNQTYYIPYYLNYFMMLQDAFTEIERMLAADVDAYVVVVNNTARKFKIPVDSFVKETWEQMGYSAVEDERLTNERSHVGSINPRAVGFKARHMEYALRISRHEQ